MLGFGSGRRIYGATFCGSTSTPGERPRLVSCSRLTVQGQAVIHLAVLEEARHFPGLGEFPRPLMPLDFRRIFPRPWRLASAGPGAGRGASVELSPPAPGRWHALCADQAFWGVVAVWLLCWLGWAILLDRYSCPLPFADDYQACVHGLMTGEQPLTLE